MDLCQIYVGIVAVPQERRQIIVNLQHPHISAFPMQKHFLMDFGNNNSFLADILDESLKSLSLPFLFVFLFVLSLPLFL